MVSMQGLGYKEILAYLEGEYPLEEAALDESEMENLGIKQDEVILDLEIGDVVTVLSGAWEGTVGAVQTINEQKKSLTINVELFGRETPVELGFSEVKKMD